MGLSEYQPITVNPVTVRGSHKHTSTLTKFLPEEHSTKAREISQEIGNGHTTNTNKRLGGWEGKKYGVDPP